MCIAGGAELLMADADALDKTYLLSDPVQTCVTFSEMKQISESFNVTDA